MKPQCAIPKFPRRITTQNSTTCRTPQPVLRIGADQPSLAVCLSLWRPRCPRERRFVVDLAQDPAALASSEISGRCEVPEAQGGSGAPVPAAWDGRRSRKPSSSSHMSGVDLDDELSYSNSSQSRIPSRHCEHFRNACSLSSQRFSSSHSLQTRSRSGQPRAGLELSYKKHANRVPKRA